MTDKQRNWIREKERAYRKVARVCYIQWAVISLLAILVIVLLAVPATAERPEASAGETDVSSGAPEGSAVEQAVDLVLDIPDATERTELGEFTVSHYCACVVCCGKDVTDPAYGITATGTVATQGRTVAVDPSVIPYGTELLLEFEDGSTATYIAEDCGGAIRGNRLDVFMENHADAFLAGMKTARVFVVE